MMKKYLTEGIGTFLLVLIVLMASYHPETPQLAPLVIGLGLAAVIYAGEHLSGAHYNPAVTLAMLMRGRVDRNDAVYYVIAQLAGALLAALLGGFLLRCGYETDTHLHTYPNAVCAVFAEFIGTFALVFVVLNTLAVKKREGNGYYGLAIGLIYAVNMHILGNITGGGFNPAVAIGTAITGMASFGEIFIFMLGTLLGAAAAVTAFQLTAGEEA